MKKFMWSNIFYFYDVFLFVSGYICIFLLMINKYYRSKVKMLYNNIILISIKNILINISFRN